MKKRYYDLASLEELLRSFEESYGVASEDFYDEHAAGRRLPGVTGFHAGVWASFYREALELRGANAFASRAERLLELA